MRIVTHEPAVEIKSRTLSAHDFAACTSDEDRTFMFATNKNMAAKALRDIAAMIDDDRIVLRSARVCTLTNSEEFLTTALRLVFFESVKVKHDRQDSAVATPKADTLNTHEASAERKDARG